MGFSFIGKDNNSAGSDLMTQLVDEQAKSLSEYPGARLRPPGQPQQASNS
jgi:hypothetical protein